MNCPIDLHRLVDDNPYLKGNINKLAATAIINNITLSTGETVTDVIDTKENLDKMHQFIKNIVDDYLERFSENDFLSKSYKDNSIFTQSYANFRETGDNVIVSFIKAATRAGFVDNIANYEADEKSDLYKIVKDTLEDKNGKSPLNDTEKQYAEKVFGTPKLKVLMASEASDPIFYVDKLLPVIEKREHNGVKFQMLQFMTKHDGEPLRKILQTNIPKTLHFSITGLGGTIWEPGVMKPDDLLDRIENFIKEGLLKSGQVTIRIDPIIPGVTTPAMIKHIVERATSMGVNTFKFSLLDSYGNTDGGKSDRFVVSEMRKRGYNWEKYYNMQNGKYLFSTRPEYFDKIYSFMDNLAEEYQKNGIILKFNTCGERPESANGKKYKHIKFAEGCLTVKKVEDTLGVKGVVDEEKENKRGGCTCFNGKVDILSYNDKCASSCGYCYATHGTNYTDKYYNEDGTLKKRLYYNEDGSIKDNTFTRTGNDEFDKFLKKVKEEEKKLDGIVEVKSTVNTEEYTISDGNFVSDFTKGKGIINITDKKLLTQLSQLKENDLVRTKLNNTVTTAYVKSITPISGGIQIEFYPKSSIAVEDGFDLSDNILKNLYLSLSKPLEMNGVTLSARQKLGAAKYAMRIKTVADYIEGTMDNFIEEHPDSYIEGSNDYSSVLNRMDIEDTMNGMKDYFQDEANKPFDEAVNEFATEIAERDNVDIETATEMAKKYVSNRLKAYQEIVENWDSIKFDALTYFAKKLNVTIVINDDNTTTAKTKENDDSDDTDNEDNFKDKENQEKESWQFDQANAHVFSSLSIQMKTILESLPLIDTDGNQVLDEMGEPVMLSKNKAYMELQNLLLPADDIKEMYQILRDNSKDHPEYEELIRWIEDDQNEGTGKYQQIFFQLFNAQVNNFVNFTTYSHELYEGVFEESISAIPVAEDENVKELFEGTLANIRNKRILNDRPLYGVEDHRGNLGLFYNSLNDIEVEIKKFKRTHNIKADKEISTREDYLEFIEGIKDENLQGMYNSLLSLGFDITFDEFNKSIRDFTIDDYPLIKLQSYLSPLYSKIYSNRKPVSGDKKNNNLTGYYKYISTLLNVKRGDNGNKLAVVVSNNKTYAQFKKPSYFSKLFKHLTQSNTEKRKEFIEKEFRKYDWFCSRGNKEEVIQRINDTIENNKTLDNWQIRQLSNVKKMILNEESAERINNYLNDYCLKEYESDVEDAVDPHTFTEILGIDSYIPDEWHNEILEELYKDGVEPARMFNHEIALAFGDKNHEGWSNEEYIKICLTQYFRTIQSKPKYARFVVPILADATSTEFVTLKKRGGVNACTDALWKVYKQELDRIALVQEREEMRKVAYKKYNDAIDAGKKILLQGIPEYSCPIANFDIEDTLEYDEKGHITVTKTKNKQGSKFNFLSFLYNYTDNPLNISKEDFDDYVWQEINKEASKIQEEVDLKEFRVTIGPENTYAISQKELLDYCAESMYATAMIEEITITDLAQYINAIDFQKRYKQVYASTSRMDIYSKYGRENERNIILKDIEVNRLSKDIINVINKCFYFSEEQKQTLIDEFKKVNWTDAQSFRSLSSYRAILSMSGQWIEETHGVLFDKLSGKNKEPITAEELGYVMQTKKPFVFTSKPVGSKVPGKSDMRVGFQVKNSEFLLLWAFKQMDTLGNERGGVIKALNQFMEDNNIDVVHFESAIKVGLQGAISLSNINAKPDYNKIKEQFPKGEHETDDEYKKRLQDEYNSELVKYNQKNYSKALRTLYLATGIKEGRKNESYEEKEARVNDSFNPEVVHVIPYSEYGIISSTPEHYIDHKQRLGTQLLRLITADNFGEYYVNGNKMNSDEMWKYLNSLLNAKMLNHFKNVQHKFSSNTELEKYLLNRMRNDDKYSEDIIHSVHLNKDGEFDLLGDPVVSAQIESLLNSLIRKEINEMKVEGGTCIQVTSALAHDLKIKWNEIKDSKGKVVDRNIAYLECRLPFQFKKLYSKFMDENGMISIDKINELCDETTARKLLRLVGCRIPTESKHSIQHLKVVGFLPQNNGSAIMLPAEITKISGSDFDVDKMFLYRYNFNIDKETGLPKFVHYKNTPIEKMSESQLNNAIIDAIWSVLSSPSSAAQMLTPSNFDESKRWGYIAYLMNEPAYHKAVCMAGNLDENNYKVKDKYNFLVSCDTDTLADIMSATSNRLGLSNQLRFFEANTKGKSLLGIMAVNSVGQSLFQHSNITIKDSLTFEINGNKFISLSSPKIKYADGTEQLSTKYIQEWLTAAADNTKDPVLSYLGVTHELINPAIAMCRLGYPIKDIALFFNNPIVRKIREYLKGSSYIDKYSVQNAIISYLEENAARDFSNVNGEEATDEDLEIELGKTFRNVTHLDGISIISSAKAHRLTTDDLLTTNNEEAILDTLMKLTIIGEDLNELTSITRADSTSGNVSSSMAGNLSKLLKQNYIVNKIKNNQTALAGTYNMIKDININSNMLISDNVKKILLNMFNESDTGYIQGQNSLALQSLFGFFYKKIPAFCPFVIDACKNLALTSPKGYLSEKQVKKVVNEYIKSMLYQIPFFGDEVIENKKTGEKVLFKTKDKIDFFRDNMWNIILAAKSKYPELSNNKLLQMLKLKKAPEKKQKNSKGYYEIKKKGYDTVVLPDAGNLTIEAKEEISNAWHDLLNSPIEEIRKLGKNLILYSFYRTGLSFHPDGFGHLAPNARVLIDKYVEQIRNCNTNTNNGMSLRQFLTQFVKNNTDILDFTYDKAFHNPFQRSKFQKDKYDKTKIKYISYIKTLNNTNTETYSIGIPESNDFLYYDVNNKEEFKFPAVQSGSNTWNDEYLNRITELNKIAETEDKGVLERLEKETLSITNKNWC